MRAGFVTLAPLYRHEADILDRRLLGERDEPSAGLPLPERPGDALRWLRRMRRERAEARSLVFGIRAAGIGLVGTGRLGALSWDSGSALISFWICQAQRRRGYGTEGARLLLDLALRRLRFAEVRTYVRESNHASRQILEGLGFAPVTLSGRISTENDDLLSYERHIAPRDGENLPSRRADGLLDIGGRPTMLMIRREQMDAFARLHLGDLARGFAADVRRRHGFAVEHLSADEVDARATEAAARAWDYGLRADRDLRAFTHLAFLVGPRFDRYPLFHAILTRGAIAESRMEVLFGIADRLDWRAAARLGH